MCLCDRLRKWVAQVLLVKKVSSVPCHGPIWYKPLHRNTHTNTHTPIHSSLRCTSYLQPQHICLGGKSLAATQSKQDHIKFLYLLTIHYHNWLCEGFQGKVDVGVCSSWSSERKRVPVSPHLQLKTSLDMEFIYHVNGTIEAGFSSVLRRGQSKVNVNNTPCFSSLLLYSFFLFFCLFY